MARTTRYIKIGFFNNVKLGKLDPLARLAFAGLWMLVDREGRVEDEPLRIKAMVLPYDTCNMDLLLNDLMSAGFIDRYEADGLNVIEVVKFGIHQRIHKDEAQSNLPSNPGKFYAGPMASNVAIHKAVKVKKSINLNLNSELVQFIDKIKVDWPTARGKETFDNDSVTALSRAQNLLDGDIVTLDELIQAAENYLAFNPAYPVSIDNFFRNSEDAKWVAEVRKIRAAGGVQ